MLVLFEVLGDHSITWGISISSIPLMWVMLILHRTLNPEALSKILRPWEAWAHLLCLLSPPPTTIASGLRSKITTSSPNAGTHIDPEEKLTFLLLTDLTLKQPSRRPATCHLLFGFVGMDPLPVPYDLRTIVATYGPHMAT